MQTLKTLRQRIRQVINEEAESQARFYENDSVPVGRDFVPSRKGVDWLDFQRKKKTLSAYSNNYALNAHNNLHHHAKLNYESTGQNINNNFNFKKYIQYPGFMFGKPADDEKHPYHPNSPMYHVAKYTEFSTDINSSLVANRGKVDPNSPHHEAIRSIDKVVTRKENALKTPLVVFSGIHHLFGDDIKKVKPGSRVFFPAYTSTSTNHDVAHGFARASNPSSEYNNSGLHVAVFHLPEGYHKGRYVQSISMVQPHREDTVQRGEEEMILGRGQRFVKKETRYNKFNDTYYHVFHVPGEDLNENYENYTVPVKQFNASPYSQDASDKAAQRTELYATEAEDSHQAMEHHAILNYEDADTTLTPEDKVKYRDYHYASSRNLPNDSQNASQKMSNRSLGAHRYGEMFRRDYKYSSEYHKHPLHAYTAGSKALNGELVDSKGKTPNANKLRSIQMGAYNLTDGEKVIKGLDKHLRDKRNALTAPARVYSGLGLHVATAVANANEGELVHFPAYTSTSLNPYIAHSVFSHTLYNTESGLDGSPHTNLHKYAHVAVFHLPKGFYKGRHIQSNSSFTSEDEYLLDRNQVWQKGESRLDVPHKVVYHAFHVPKGGTKMKQTLREMKDSIKNGDNMITAYATIKPGHEQVDAAVNQEPDNENELVAYATIKPGHEGVFHAASEMNKKS